MTAGNGYSGSFITTPPTMLSCFSRTAVRNPFTTDSLVACHVR